MEPSHNMNMNLTDRTFTILRKRNFLPLTFQEFRGQYATTYNVMHPPERAKLMKLAIIKVSYSQQHKKQTMKVLIEKDYICDSEHRNVNELECNKLHCLKSSDRCHLFDKHQTCHNPKCTKLHIPSKSLHCRTMEIFKKSSRSCMPFSKFIVLHRTTYPHLREHHPTNDILTTDEFADIVKIENTEKTKQIRLIRRRPSGDKYSGIERPPALSENIDAPYPALKIISFDAKWLDTEQLLHDITNLFCVNRIKDIFIPGHIRMAFVTFNTWSYAQSAVKKLNNTWFCGRKVTVCLTQNNHNIECKDEEKVASSSSSRIVIKPINNVISQQGIKEWLDGIGGIQTIETCFVQCRKGSDTAYLHFKSMKVIHDILNKERCITLRGKKIELMLCDDGYTDSSSYFSLKTKQSDEQKQKLQPVPVQLQKAKSFNAIQNKEGNDSMQLLVMRLKSLIESTIETQKELETKLSVLAIIDNGFTLTHDSAAAAPDIDAAFGDETYTIQALRESLHNMINDKKQIQVYKQALTAFETSQSRAINKNQRELKPIGDKEIRLAKSLQSVKSEIDLLQKQLALKRNEKEAIKSELQITRIKTKSLRQQIHDMKDKIEPIRHCLAAFDANKNKHRSHRRSSSNHHRRRNVEIIRADKIPNDEQVDKIKTNLLQQEKRILHWLKWKQWNLEDATLWIASLENGKFKPHISKFKALSKLKGSILNAITDPTLQIIGIDQPEDRTTILHNIAMLKSRTAMMRKCAETFANPKFSATKPLKHRGNRSETLLLRDRKKNKRRNASYGLDDIGLEKMIRSASAQSDTNIDDLCVICMDRHIAPYAMVPCGHQCLCSICKNLIKPNAHKCPMCNGKVTMIIKLFRA